MDKLIHVFEFNGVGTAPFKCVGVASLPSTSLAEANPDAYNQAMRDLPKGFNLGSCKVCGTSLINNFLIIDADNAKFSVGCDCVEKSGDNGLIQEVKAIKLEKERAKRAEKRHQKQLENQRVYEKELDLERARNGGLTDRELLIQKQQEIEDQKILLLTPLANALYDGKGGFRDSVCDDLNSGKLPTGRGRDIMIGIIAKQKGKLNSEQYKIEVARIEKIILEVSSIENV
ncbi:MAG: hypothetical protein QM500_19935 [Methylococcales bacterium]